MKRDDLKVGGIYVTNDGEVIEVAWLDPGWSLNTEGEWFEDPQWGRRFMGEDEGFREDKSNLKIRAWVLDEEGKRRLSKTVIEPRSLMHSLAEHKDYLKRKRSEERQRAADYSRIRKALEGAGLAHVRLNMDAGRAEVDRGGGRRPPRPAPHGLAGRSRRRRTQSL